MTNSGGKFHPRLPLLGSIVLSFNIRHFFSTRLEPGRSIYVLFSASMQRPGHPHVTRKMTLLSRIRGSNLNFSRLGAHSRLRNPISALVPLRF